MKAQNTLNLTDPLNEDDVIAAAKLAIEQLMAEEFVVHTDLIGDAFKSLMDEVKALTGHEESMRALLQQAMDESKAYFTAHVEKPKKASTKVG
jgi:CRISPR-associated protein Csc2